MFAKVIPLFCPAHYKDENIKAIQNELMKYKKELEETKESLDKSRIKIIQLEIELNESSLILSEILKISGGEFDRSFGLKKRNSITSRLHEDNGRSSNDGSLSTIRHVQTIKNSKPAVSEKPDATTLTRKIKDLSNEIKIKNSKIIEQQKCLSILEEALKENNNIAEFDQLLAVIRSKDERINQLEQTLESGSGENIIDYKDKRIIELEEALKESFVIATEREKVFHEEEQRRIDTLNKMEKMEQRLLSLQNASALNCDTCRPLLKKLQRVEQKLHCCRVSRHEQLKQLSAVIQETLENSISDHDARIAQLEECGVLTEELSLTVVDLRRERSDLVDRLRKENQLIIDTLKVLEDDLPETVPERRLDIDLTLADHFIGVDDNDIADTPETVL